MREGHLGKGDLLVSTVINGQWLMLLHACLAQRIAKVNPFPPIDETSTFVAPYDYIDYGTQTPVNATSHHDHVPHLIFFMM